MKLGPLWVAKVDVPGGTSKAYFYLTYKVTNASGTDVSSPLHGIWRLRTGELPVQGRNVPAAVTQELLKTLHSDYLQDQISIIGVLMQGKRTPRTALSSGRSTISGSTKWTSSPGVLRRVQADGSAEPSSGEKEKVLLRKTLMARYSTRARLRTIGAPVRSCRGPLDHAVSGL